MSKLIYFGWLFFTTAILAQVDQNQVLADFKAAHADPYGYEVQAETQIDGQIVSSMGYELFGSENAWLYRFDAQNERFMNSEMAIRLDHYQKLMVIESPEGIEQLKTWWGTDTEEDTDRPDFTITDDGQFYLLFIPDSGDGTRQWLTLRKDDLKVIKAKVEFAIDGEEPIITTMTMKALTTVSKETIEQRYIHITDQNIHPKSNFADYEVYNVLF